MAKRMQLKKRQLEVIEDMVSGGRSEASVLKKHGVSRHVYRKWLGNERFAEELEFRIEAVRREGMLAIAKNTKKAAKMLVELTQSENPETARKACVDIVSLGEKDVADRREHNTKEDSGDVKIDTVMAGRIVAALSK